VKPVKELNIGISFRSPFHLDIKDGDVTLTDNNIALGGPFPATSKAKTTIKMPATAALGVAYRFFDKLTIEADVDWTFWSSFNELNIQNQSSPALSSTPTGRQRNWKDVAAYRIGGEYRVTAPLALRLGFAYDKSPVPSNTMGAELPDADRMNYMAGVGYKFANWTIDGSYFYVRKKDRSASNIRLEENGNPIGFNGTWKGDAHLVALDVGYRF
jgi:long-chain fatty acid transport protein